MGEREVASEALEGGDPANMKSWYESSARPRGRVSGADGTPNEHKCRYH